MFHTHQDFMVALAEGFKGARPIAVSVMSSSSGGIRKCWRVSVEKDGRITAATEELASNRAHQDPNATYPWIETSG